MVVRVRQAMRQLAVISEQQQSLAILIEPARHAQPRYGHKTPQCITSLGIVELRKDIVGFVE